MKNEIKNFLVDASKKASTDMNLIDNYLNGGNGIYSIDNVIILVDTENI